MSTTRRTRTPVEEEMTARISGARRAPERENKPPPHGGYFNKEVMHPYTGKGKLLTELFPIELPEGLVDFTIPVFEDRDWHEEVRGLIPDLSVVENHVWDPEQLYDFLVGFVLHDRIWLTGPTGSGKTSLPRAVCAVLRIPFIRINGRGDLESAHILGGYVVQDGATHWKDGPCTIACKYGGIYLQDEPTAIPAEVSLVYQALLEDNGKLLLTDKAASLGDKIVVPHEWFTFVVADNTRGLGDEKGAFAGTNVWNTATLDRFGTTIFVDYLDAAKEISILTKVCPQLKPELAERMVQVAKLVRAGYEQDDLSLSMSPRPLLSWAKKALLYKDVSRAFKTAFYEKLPNESERIAVEGIYKTVFDEEV